MFRKTQRCSFSPCFLRYASGISYMRAAEAARGEAPCPTWLAVKCQMFQFYKTNHNWNANVRSKISKFRLRPARTYMYTYRYPLVHHQAARSRVSTGTSPADLHQRDTNNTSTANTQTAFPCVPCVPLGTGEDHLYAPPTRGASPSTTTTTAAVLTSLHKSNG